MSEIARLPGHEREDGNPAPSQNPVAVEIIDIVAIRAACDGSSAFEKALNLHISNFFERWRETHVLSAPSYIIGSNGEERLYLQAVDRNLWLRQNEESGIAAARQQVAAHAEGTRLTESKVQLVTGQSFHEVPAPAGPEARRGGFPGLRR